MDIVKSHSQKKENSRFLFLLVSLVFLILAAPYLIKTPIRSLTMNIISAVILVAAVYEVRAKKNILIIALCLAIASVIVHALFLLYTTTLTDTLDSAVSAIFLGFIAIRIFKAMIQGYTISLSTIYGAMCIYLLLGIFFGDIYSIIESLKPGTFVASGLYGAPIVISRYKLATFSYAMLTTVGHSKVITTNIAADSFVIIEELTGVLYLAVLIARLVTGFSFSHKDKI